MYRFFSLSILQKKEANKEIITAIPNVDTLPGSIFFRCSTFGHFFLRLIIVIGLFSFALDTSVVLEPSAITHKSSNIFERHPNAKIVPNVAPKPNLSPSKKRHKKKNNSVSNNTSSPVGRTLTTSPKYAFTKMKIHRSRKKNRYTISPQKYSTCWRCGAPGYGGTHYCFEHLKENNEY